MGQEIINEHNGRTLRQMEMSFLFFHMGPVPMRISRIVMGYPVTIIKEYYVKHTCCCSFC